MTAHHLDKHINVAAFGQGYRVAFPSIGRQIHAARLLRVAGRYGHNLNLAAGARGQKVAVALHNLDHAKANRAKACQSDTQGGKLGLAHFGPRALTVRFLLAF